MYEQLLEEQITRKISYYSIQNMLKQIQFYSNDSIIFQGLLYKSQMKLSRSKTPLPPTTFNTLKNEASPVRYQQEDRQLPLSPQVKSIIRRKVSSYLNCQLAMTPFNSRQLTLSKKNKSKPLPKEFPDHANLLQFMKDQKVFFHLYKQKIDRSMDECLFFFLKVLALSIDYQSRISQKQLDSESSIMIEAFIFLASSLFEAGAQKSAFYFSTMAIIFCEYYKKLHPIGQFLLIMAKINRKFFKYKESILLLKKALEYNWWKDYSRAELLENQFKKWLLSNSPDELQIYMEKYQIARVFNEPLTFRTNKSDLQIKVFKDLFNQFLQSSKIRNDVIIYDLTAKRPKNTQNRRAADLQLQIYNEMSFNFLQLNKKEQSKVFAQKYESGYTEPQESKIISLSRELITSIQKRISGWHQIDRKSFQLLFFVDVFEILSDNRQKMRILDEQIILESFKVTFDSLYQTFIQKQMFHYQIPLPLEIKRDIPKSKRKSDGKKFIIRQRSSSHMAKQNVQIIKKYTSDKVQQNLIFNYRGLKISRLKLLDIYTKFIDHINQKQQQGSFKRINWR